MKRLRITAFAAVACMAFVPGCCWFDGQLLNRMFPSRNGCCECSTCSSTCGSMPVVSEGPLLGNEYMTQPPGVQELPTPKIVPQAQPLPAAPVSTIKR